MLINNKDLSRAFMAGAEKLWPRVSFNTTAGVMADMCEAISKALVLDNNGLVPSIHLVCQTKNCNGNVIIYGTVLIEPCGICKKQNWMVTV